MIHWIFLSLSSLLLSFSPSPTFIPHSLLSFLKSSFLGCNVIFFHYIWKLVDHFFLKIALFVIFFLLSSWSCNYKFYNDFDFIHQGSVYFSPYFFSLHIWFLLKSTKIFFHYIPKSWQTHSVTIFTCLTFYRLEFPLGSFSVVSISLHNLLLPVLSNFADHLFS